jgi:hypothetical protein
MLEVVHIGRMDNVKEDGFHVNGLEVMGYLCREGMVDVYRTSVRVLIAKKSECND